MSVRFLLIHTLIGVLFAFNASLISAEVTENDSENPIIEIKDKYGEVKLGLTSTTLYMIISEEIKDNTNAEFQNQYKIDMHNYYDSEGNFFPNSNITLTSNKIEIELDDISSIEFNNGKIDFNFSSSGAINPANIYSSDGISVLENFYMEDLESFYLAYKNHSIHSK